MLEGYGGEKTVVAGKSAGGAGYCRGETYGCGGARRGCGRAGEDVCGKAPPAVHVASAHDVEARGMQWTDGVPWTSNLLYDFGRKIAKCKEDWGLFFLLTILLLAKNSPVYRCI